MRYADRVIALGELGIVVYFAVLALGAFLVPFGLPGTWVQVGAAAVLAFVTRGGLLGWWWVAGFVGLAAVGEVVEFVSGQWGTRRFGGSSRAAWGALVGGLVGVIVGLPVPVVGPILASFLGVFAGALIGEMSAQGTVVPELRVGVGAVLGRAIGVGAKVGVAITIIGGSVVGMLVAVRDT